MLKLDLKYTQNFIDIDYEKHQEEISRIHQGIFNKNLRGHDYLGWVELPNNPLNEDLLKSVNRLIKNSDILVVIGIGGSYLGAKAGLEFLSKPFIKEEKQVIFAGHHLSEEYLQNLLIYLEDKRFAINVISKSGTTTEPAIAFRFLLDLAKKKYRQDVSKYVVVTTDKKRGALYNLALENGFDRFVIEDDIGGRYSVLSPVGLLPLMYQGHDGNKILKGAQQAYVNMKSDLLAENDAYKYALVRNLLYKDGKKIEMLVNYEPRLIYFSEWWKQLFGESEGKENKGLFVASAAFTTDLHSLGQYIQEGERHLFETVINISQTESNLIINKTEDNLDELNYLAGKSVFEVNQQALKGTMLAHIEGSVPNILITISNPSEETFGYLTYFFMRACAMSAYLLEINPFDQPGVEAYKTNMFTLLGKKGYEEK